VTAEARARSASRDAVVMGDRLSYLLVVRLAIGCLVIVGAVRYPELLGVPLSSLAVATGAYLVTAVVLEGLRRRVARLRFLIVTALFLLDGVFLAYAMYATGGTQSPVRFLVYLQLIAVCLLASYRTGLKMALWDSLLLFVVIYAQAARLVPAVDVTAGEAVSFDEMPVLNVTSFWLFAIAASLFSAINERELRNRRADLQTLVDLGSRLDDTGDPVRQSTIVLEGLSDRFGFTRGVVLGASEGDVVVLAGLGTGELPTSATAADRIVRRAWDRRELLPVKRIDSGENPLLAFVLPDARNLLVAPLMADGRPVGAIVVEHRGRRLPGVERRVADVLTQVAAMAALNLRNAVLLNHVRDLAERDALTGAANRRMFQESLERVVADRPARVGELTTVLFIDIDDFKVVNDSLGHAAGDALLVAVTERISSIVRATDLVARLGGDEFAILTEDDLDLHRSRAMAERLVTELRAPYILGDDQVIVTASIGIATVRDAAAGAMDLVRNADVAMYMAKANGKAGYAIFDPGMHETIRERHELSVELQRAIELNQIRIAYQPIVDLTTGRPMGVEALARWEHPTRGLIPPARFIELAEENGTIVPMGRWILRQACTEVSTWRIGGHVPEDIFVSVNVSAKEIQQPGFVGAVAGILADTGLTPRRLVVELTETALLKANPATIEILNQLRDLGVRMVIDDFGTGYFSLSHLRQFPVDALKIAAEFVQDSDPASRSWALAGAIVAMGRSLGIATVAEGIESPAQAARMRAMGCTYGQGFHFARPLPTDAVVRAFGLDPAPVEPVLRAVGEPPAPIDPPELLEPAVQVKRSRAARPARPVTIPSATVQPTRARRAARESSAA
jgi:diguanylate cyclase (GGDEF)-like protein